MQENDKNKINFYFTIRNMLIDHFELNNYYNNQLTDRQEKVRTYIDNIDAMSFEGILEENDFEVTPPDL